MPLPPRRAVKKTAVPAAKATPAKAAAPKEKLRSAGGTKKYQFPMEQYLEKDPTAVHTNFVEWVKEQTGYEADPKTVQLAFVLRIPFQRSEQNQTDLEARRKAAEEAKTSKPVVKAGPTKRVPGKRSAPAKTVEEAPVPDEVDEVEEVEEAPVKKAPRRATKAPAKTPVKPNSGPAPRARKAATPKATKVEEEAF